MISKQQSTMRRETENNITRMALAVVESQATVTIRFQIGEPRESAETTATFRVSNSIRGQNGGRKSRGVEGVNHFITHRTGETGHPKIAKTHRVMSALISHAKRWNRHTSGKVGQVPKEGDVLGRVSHGATIHMRSWGRARGNRRSSSIASGQIRVESGAALMGLTKEGIEGMKGINTINKRTGGRRGEGC